MPSETYSAQAKGLKKSVVKVQVSKDGKSLGVRIYDAAETDPHFMQVTEAVVYKHLHDIGSAKAVILARFFRDNRIGSKQLQFLNDEAAKFLNSK